MGSENERSGVNSDGSVSVTQCRLYSTYIQVSTDFSMAVGLGLTREEWATLRGQVDDSFWVMRVIGIVHGGNNEWTCAHVSDRLPTFTEGS